jgi:hypothetical protein
MLGYGPPPATAVLARYGRHRRRERPKRDNGRAARRTAHPRRDARATSARCPSDQRGPEDAERGDRERRPAGGVISGRWRRGSSSAPATAVPQRPSTAVGPAAFVRGGCAARTSHALHAKRLSAPGGALLPGQTAQRSRSTKPGELHLRSWRTVRKSADERPSQGAERVARPGVGAPGHVLAMCSRGSPSV